MSVEVATTRVACSTGGGTQDITIDRLGNRVPAAALFFVTRATTDGDFSDHAIFGMGAATDTSEQWAWCIKDEDGQNPTDLDRRGATDECVMILDTAGNVDGEANFSAFIAGGVRINWGNTPAAAYLLTVVLFVGSSLSAKADVFTTNALQNNSTDVNTVGFPPDVLLTSCFGFTFTDATAAGTLPAIGTVTNKASVSQFCWGMGGSNGVSPSGQFAQITDDYGTGQVNAAGGWTWAGEFGSFDSDGFSCTTRLGGSGGDQVGYLALAFNGAVDFWAGIIDTPTSTGNQLQTGPGFEPQAVITAVTQMPAIDTGYTNGNAGSVGVSVFDGSEEYCNSVQIEDAVVASDTKSLSDNASVLLPNDDGTMGHMAFFKSFDPTGWTWNFTQTEGTAVKYWALAIGAFSETATPTINAPSCHQSRALTLVARQPLWVGSAVIDDNLGLKTDAIQVVWTALGGYWSLRFNLKGNQDAIEDWLESGLGRDITLYSHTLVPIWEGEVSAVSGNIGSFSQTRGPLLDTVVNRLAVAYSTVDTSVTPPAVGVREVTAWGDDTDSQNRYGIIERVASIGGANATTAEQIRDTRLADFAEPRTSETDNLQSQSETSVTVECLGYVHRLKSYVYNSSTTGLQNASAKLQAVLAADPNSIFSTDYSQIATNTTQVGAWENDNRPGWDIVKGVTALGDSSFSRYLFGIYANRLAYYNAVPTTPKFQRSLGDPGQWLELFGSGGRLAPWEVEPGEWVFYTDLFTGRTQQTTLRLDPRYLLIEQGNFATPWSLTMQGGDANRTDQLLAQLGLAGSGA